MFLLKVKHLFSKNDWASIGLIFIISAAAFLPLVGKLGYYHDDWFTTISRISGVSLLRMHLVDRPVQGLWYMIVSFVLGENPLAWHLYTFIVRFAGALALLWVIRMLWPKHPGAGILIALQFAIYPGFLQQPSANNYSNIVFAYSIFLLSLAFTVRILNSTHRWEKTLLTLIAVGMTAFYIMVYEAMIGLEIFRFCVVWVILKRNTFVTLKETTWRALLRSFPHLLVVGLFVAWRLFFFQSTRQSTDTSLLFNQYLSEPLEMALQIGVGLIKDFIETVVGAWIIPGYQLGINARALDSLIAIIIGVFMGGVLLIFHRWQIWPASDLDEKVAPDWSREAILIGLVGVLVTLLPVALTGRDVQYRIFLDRYTYQSIAPTAFLITGVFYAVLRPGWQYRAAALLVFLAIFIHFINATNYAENWAMQKQVWWQMTWRVPEFEEGTSLVIHMPPGFRYPEDFEIWAPASRIYYPVPGPLRITAEVLNAETLQAMLDRETTGRNYRGVIYTRDFNRALIFSVPTVKSCLHLMDGQELELSIAEDPLVRQVSVISRPDLIKVNAESKIPPVVIFGSEPPFDWCYYYQKASLARQKGDWDEVVRLGDAAFAAGQAPGDLIEYAPFIEGYLHRNQPNEAKRIVSIIKTEEPQTALNLCKNYQTPLSDPDRKVAQAAVELLCDN